MKKLLSCVSTLLASVFALLTVVAIPLSAMAFNAGGTLFNPDMMKEISVEAVADADFLSRFAYDMMEKGKSGNGEGEEAVEDPALKVLFARLDRSDWERLMDILLPDKVLAAYIESALDGLYGWLDSDQPLPDIQLDLSPVKERLVGTEGEDIARILFASLPPCTTEQMEAIQEDPGIISSPPELFELSCKVPGVPPEAQIDVYERVLFRLAGELPSEVDLAREIENGEGEEDLLQAKQALWVIRQAARLIYLLPFGCLLLVTLFGVRSVGGLGGWWGIPIALGSGISLTVSYLLPPWLLARFMEISEGAPSYVQPVGLDFFQRVARAIFQPLRWQSLAGAGIGLMLMGLMVIMDWRRKHVADSTAERIL